MSEIKNCDENNFDKEVIDSNPPVLVDFGCKSRGLV